MTYSLQIGAAMDPWITVTGLESVVEEMSSSGNGDIKLINSALEEIVKGLSEKTKPGNCWTSVAPPLPWKKHANQRDQIEKRWEELKQIYSKKVHFIPKLSKLAFGTGNDEVHLVDKSRERFFLHVIESSITAFMSESSGEESAGDEERSIDMDINEQTIIHPKSQGPRTSTPALTFRSAKRKATTNIEEYAQLKRIKNKPESDTGIDQLTKRVEQRWRSDNLLLAKHDEQLDILKNEKNLDRIVISGVHIAELTGNLDEQKPKMFEAVTKILKSFMDDPPAPTFAKHLNAQYKTPRRVLEVRFGDTDKAVLVRKTYAKKVIEFQNAKNFPVELNGVGIGMTLTKSTRIRIAILRGLAKIVGDNTEQNVKAYCMEYQTQPLLKIVIELDANRKTTRTFGFTEAIEHVAEHFGIQDHDLVDAYTLAGNTRQIEQKFVVLRSSANRFQNN